MSETLTSEAPARRGAPRKANADAVDQEIQKAPEVEARAPVREPARTPVPHGRAVALDRDGKPLFRRRDNTEDKFHVPEELKDADWDYQWCVKSVLGEDQHAATIRDMENGWRPIQADRNGFVGRFMPEGYKGAIEREGLVLCERPMSLTEEARAEDRQNANRARRENRERFGLPALPAGFEDRQDRLGQFGKGKPGVHVSTYAAPRAEGKYQLAIDGDE